MQIEVTDKELLIIRAALMAVSPSGGGSAPYTLYRKLPDVGQHPETIVDDTEESRLLMQFCNTVIDDAVEAGAITLAADNR